MRISLLAAAILASGAIAGSALAQQLPAGPTAAVIGTPGLVQMGGVGVPQAFGSNYASPQSATPWSNVSATPLFVERGHSRP